MSITPLGPALDSRPEFVSVTPEPIVLLLNRQLAPASTVSTPKLVKLVPNPESVPVAGPAASSIVLTLAPAPPMTLP